MATKENLLSNEKGQTLIEAAIATLLATTFCMALFQLLSSLVSYALLKSYIYSFGICELSVKPHHFFCQQRVEQNVKTLFPKVENFKYSHMKSNNRITINAEGKVWNWIPIKVKQSLSI
jgi:hypothetical protein